MRPRTVAGTLFLALLGLCGNIWAQEKQGVEDQLLVALNQMRSQAGKPAVKTDERLADAARMHLAEFLKHGQATHQYEGEADLTHRLGLAQVACGAAGEVVFKVDSAEHASAELKREATDKVLLNPKFSLAAFAVMQEGSDLYVVGDLAQPLRMVSADEAEGLVADALQKLRERQKLVPLSIVPMRSLRGIACEMAKKDTLQVETVNPFTDSGNVADPSRVRSLRFTTTEPANLPVALEEVAGDPKMSSASVGTCFARSQTYPDGVYWAYVIVYYHSPFFR